MRGKTVVEKLALLPAAALPSKVEVATGGNPWRRPALSRRQLADLKKQAAAAALEWPIAEKEVAPGQSFHERKVYACKGNKHERDAPKRQESIAEKMASMAAKIEEHRADQRKKRFRTDLQKVLSLPRSKSSR